MIQRILPLGAGFLIALGSAGCCMGGGGTSAPIVPPAIPSVAPAVAAPALAPAMAATAVTIGAGFTDPTIVATIAGGPVAGSTMSTGDVYCNGNLSVVPNVTLTTTTPIAGLRILARSTEDTTLAVRLSDGRVFCNDDGGGYPNPAILADVPAGVHQVFVGTFRSGETGAATVAFTTNPALANETLP